MGVILRSAFLGALGFGAAFALVGLFFLDAIVASLVVGLGVGITMALLLGRLSFRLAFSIASFWAFSVYLLLPGGPLAGILVAHLDERMSSILLRLALLGAITGVIGWIRIRPWRSRVDVVLAATLGLPLALLLGSALLPLFISSSTVIGIESAQSGFHKALAFSGAVGGVLAGAVIGAVIGYHSTTEERRSLS